MTLLLKYIRPRNIQIYQEAFIHKSAVRKLQKQCDTYIVKLNERLEFLGDSVLNLVTTNYLYQHFRNESEGVLTKLRIKLVKGSTLAWFAKKIGLQNHLIVSTSTVLNNNILENAFEALVGAIYLDYLYTGAEMYYVTCFIYGLFNEFVDWDDMRHDDNYKDILMRYLQKQHFPGPSYKVETITGQSHCPKYVVSISINDTIKTQKEESSKREAEQACARDILCQLKVPLASIT